MRQSPRQHHAIKSARAEWDQCCEQEAHEALYEMEMAALEAQRVAQATDAALEESDDEMEARLLEGAAAAAQQQVSIVLKVKGMATWTI